MPGKPIEEHLAAERRAVVGRMVAAVLRAVQVPPPGSLARKAAPTRPATLSQSASVSVAPATAVQVRKAAAQPEPSVGRRAADRRHGVGQQPRPAAARPAAGRRCGKIIPAREGGGGARAQACARGGARRREAGLDGRGVQPRLGGRFLRYQRRVPVDEWRRLHDR